jgi:glycerol-3-phosphate dehydrogenase (NAD(P)+)
MNIQVIGAGSFGLALTRLLANNGHAVHLWCRREEQHEELLATRESRVYLPGVSLPERVTVSRDILESPELVVLAVPSHAMRDVLKQFSFPDETVRVNVAKGIENDSLLRMSELVEEEAPGCRVVTLSGPSHAEEVARDLPASLVAAGREEAACLLAQEAFFCRTFRIYTSEDVIGVELGGSLKNVVAIAAGVCDGLELGDNAKASLITRGLAEMARLGEACGANPITFAGLSGMGDLIATCMSGHSRNRRVGIELAKGEKLEAILAATTMVAEGVRTTRSAYALAARMGVEMPITEAAHKVLFEGINPLEALVGLMTRDAKPERA